MTDETERLKGFLYDKIAQRKKRIHPQHSPRFNHDMQLEIDCYEWVLGKIDVNKIPFDRLERIIKATIKDLEKRKDKAMVRTDTDDILLNYCLTARAELQSAHPGLIRFG